MIYLDYAAATPVHPKALEAMLPYFSEQFFNPSSPYLPSKHIRDQYETAKSRLAHLIGAKSPDLVITAGATESINLAFTILKNFKSLHCLISDTEHASVRAVAQNFNHDTISVDKFGTINLDEIKSKITDHTVLISVALVDSELGTIQPLSEIAEIIREVRQSRLKSKNPTPIYLHSDASQAMSLLELSVSRLGVDLLTINSAKVYGPKGVGALYVKRGIRLSPIVFGGGQESGLRSGTENVPSLIGFSKAAEIAREHILSHRKTFLDFKKIFHQELSKAKVQPIFLGNPKRQLANFCPISFPDLDAERLIYKLEMKEIYLSTGSACAASKGQKSLSLAAIGLSESEIAGSLRITFGMQNTIENIKTAAREIVASVNEEASRLGL